MHIIQKQGLTLGLLIMVVLCYGFIVCILRLIPMYWIDILYSVHISIPPRSMFILWFAYQQIQSLIICMLLHITCILIYIYILYISYIRTIVIIWSIGRSISFCSIIDIADQIWPLAQESSMWFWLHLGFNRKLFGVSWNMPIKPTIIGHVHHVPPFRMVKCHRFPFTADWKLWMMDPLW